MKWNFQWKTIDTFHRAQRRAGTVAHKELNFGSNTQKNSLLFSHTLARFVMCIKQGSSEKHVERRIPSTLKELQNYTPKISTLPNREMR